MKEINDIHEVENLIHDSDMALIYFTGTQCGACEIIRQKVDKLLGEYPNIKSGFMNAGLYNDVNYIKEYLL